MPLVEILDGPPEWAIGRLLSEEAATARTPSVKR
jgi:hypothetical protein